MPETAPHAPCPVEFLTLAERLADAAGEIARKYFRQVIEIERKGDESPVTIADREAEAAMRRLIAERFPDHGVVGEEGAAVRAEAEYVWVLDPIDGTKRFISGHVQFGALIGLLHDGAPVLGVIDMPALGERWIGAAGCPTTHRDRDGTRPARARACAELGEATLFATSPHMFPGADFEAFERVRKRVKLPLYGSECYAYGLLASGYVDLVIEATMGAYDYLPLVAVVEGAGGTITDWAGRPLGLESDGRVLAAGDGRAHSAAMALLNEE
jgi:histidinol phosphatase-like enzyme (inositol monophosphatase family)